MENAEQKQLQPQKREITPLQRFNKVLTDPKTTDYLQSVLREKRSSFVNNIVALVSNDVKLQECTPMSVIYAGIKATALNLPLDQNLGFAYVIPYNNTKEGKKEAQFQIGYRGFIQLAIRSGQFLTINVTDIRDGEIKGKNILTGEITLEEAPDRLNRPIVGYAAYFALTSGFSKMMYMSMEEVKQHAQTYSQTYKSKFDNIRKTSKWTTDFDAMAKKTVLKLLLAKYAPLSVEMQNAITSDQAVLDEQGQPSYVDNPEPEDQTPSPDQIAQAVEDRKEEMRNSGKTPDKLL